MVSSYVMFSLLPCLHFLALVSCPTWSRHLCNLSVVAIMSLLGSNGLWDYVQIVMSNIFGSSLLYLSSWVILACSMLPYFTLAKWFIATPRGSIILYCGFNPLMSSLSDRTMRLGDVLLQPGEKRWLYLRVQGLFTLRKVLLMQLSVALYLHFGWDSQLNTNEMF